MPSITPFGVQLKIWIFPFSNHAQYAFRDFQQFAQKCGVKNEIYPKVLSYCERVKVPVHRCFSNA